ncbi:MAG TPA: hypothetical protein VIT45_17905 [Allosphingosinicella sp.]
MPGSLRPAVLMLLVLLAPPPAGAAPTASPLHFFEGKTDTESTTKIMMSKPYRTRSLGEGRIESDGSLTMVQQVAEPGKPVRQRRWHVRQVAPGRFAGTIWDETTHKVVIEEVGARYRLRLKIKGGLNVEQWLTPLPGGRSARSLMVVKKLGIVVARGEGTIRKLP